MPYPVGLSQLTNLYSQQDLQTSIFIIFSLPNKSNLTFCKGMWQWKASCEKHLVTVFVTSSKFRK